MSVVLETTKGDIAIDLFVDDAPLACQNFLKLCSMKCVVVVAAARAVLCAVSHAVLAVAAAGTTTTCCSTTCSASSWHRQAIRRARARAGRRCLGC